MSPGSKDSTDQRLMAIEGITGRVTSIDLNEPKCDQRLMAIEGITAFLSCKLFCGLFYGDQRLMAIEGITVL